MSQAFSSHPSPRDPENSPADASGSPSPFGTAGLWERLFGGAPAPGEGKDKMQARLEHRIGELVASLPVLEANSPRLRHWANLYSRDVPRVRGNGDADRFLTWLTDTQALDATQRDYVECQRACREVARLAEELPAETASFEERASLSELLGGELTDRPIRIHLNPARVWVHYETNALLGSQVEAPIDALVFRENQAAAMALFGPSEKELLHELEWLAPCTLDQWTALTERASRPQLARLCRRLAQIGLVSFS